MNSGVLSKSGFSLGRLAGFCAVAGAGSIVGAARGDTIFVLHHEDNTAIAARVREGIHDFVLIRRKQALERRGR